MKACFALLLGFRVAFLLPPAKQSKAKQASKLHTKVEIIPKKAMVVHSQC